MLAALARIIDVTAESRWYIVRCTGNHDQRVIDVLSDLGIETYYPRVRELRPVPRKKLSRSQRNAGVVILRPTVWPLLPRHIFADDSILARWRELDEIASFAGLLSFGGEPAPVSDKTIQELRSREVFGVIPNPAGKLFAVGDRVRLIDGPLALMTGKVEALPSVADERIDVDTRLRIMLDMMGRVTSVDVPIGLVERA